MLTRCRRVNKNVSRCSDIGNRLKRCLKDTQLHSARLRVILGPLAPPGDRAVQEKRARDAKTSSGTASRTGPRWSAGFHLGDYKLITRSAENVLGGLHRDEVFSLAYEHLTNHPRETLAALCRFLELPLPPRWHDAASAIFRPSSGSAKYVVWAGTARADRQRANVDKLVKGARAVLPDYSLPE